MRSSFFHKPPAPDPELQRLQEELRQAQGELSVAYNSFDQALDPELVESCVYQISAVKARCNYLLRSIKARCPEASPAMQSGKEDALWT